MELLSEIRILRSAAGHYIGRLYLDREYGFWGPWNRMSDYYPSAEAAKSDLYYEIVFGEDIEDDAETAGVRAYYKGLRDGVGHQLTIALTLRTFAIAEREEEEAMQEELALQGAVATHACFDDSIPF